MAPLSPYYRKHKSKFPVKEHTMASSLLMGEIGENLVEDILTRHPRFKVLGIEEGLCKLVSVEGNSYYQKKDIDKILVYPTGREVPLEIKTDTYNKNFYFEIDSDSTRPFSGWTFITEARLVPYVFLHLGKVYFLPFPETKNWLKTILDINTPRVVEVINRAEGRSYVSRGCPLEINWVVSELEKFTNKEIIKIDFTPWTKQQLEQEIKLLKCV